MNSTEIRTRLTLNAIRRGVYAQGSLPRHEYPHVSAEPNPMCDDCGAEAGYGHLMSCAIWWETAPPRKPTAKPFSDGLFLGVCNCSPWGHTDDCPLHKGQNDAREFSARHHAGIRARLASHDDACPGCAYCGDES